jgi:hypothetical protein
MKYADNIDQSIEHLIKTYSDFVRPWREYSHEHLFSIRYEQLRQDPITALTNVLQVLHVSRITEELLAAVDRHTIDKEIKKECNNRGLPEGTPIYGFHKGLCDEWKEHFTRSRGQRLQESPVGDLMLEQGYVDTCDWWKQLPGELQ